MSKQQSLLRSYMDIVPRTPAATPSGVAATIADCAATIADCQQGGHRLCVRTVGATCASVFYIHAMQAPGVGRRCKIHVGRRVILFGLWWASMRDVVCVIGGLRDMIYGINLRDMLSGM